MCEAIFGLALVAMIIGRLQVVSAKEEMSFTKKLLTILLIAFLGKFCHARIASRQAYNYKTFENTFEELKWYYKIETVTAFGYMCFSQAANLMFGWKFWTSSKFLYKCV